jgi:hypothetical protein
MLLSLIIGVSIAVTLGIILLIMFSLVNIAVIFVIGLFFGCYGYRQEIAPTVSRQPFAPTGGHSRVWSTWEELATWKARNHIFLSDFIAEHIGGVFNL